MISGSILPFLFIFCQSIYSLNKIINERIRIYGHSPDFKMTNIFKSKIAL
jgi:hypothetical protein